MKEPYSIELFIIKPSVQLSIKKKILTKLRKAGFIIAVEKTASFSFKDMSNFYSKENKELIGIGRATINFFKENNINIKKHFSKTTPLAIGKEIMKRQAKYMSSGPSTIIIAMKQGKDIYKDAKAVVGSTFPERAEIGTIRNMSNDSLYSSTIENRAIHNFIHSSDKENVEKEIALIKKYTINGFNKQ
jgi:nucleoside diphosphate kinase